MVYARDWQGILASLDFTNPVPAGPAEKFITFHLGRTGFIMERHHFYAAIYRNQSRNLNQADQARSLPYMSEVLNFDNSDVVMFNLDELLMDLFKLDDMGTIKVAIMAGLAVFAEGPRTAVTRMLASRFEGCVNDTIAFRISGDWAINMLDWACLRLLPAGIRDFLANRGILACHFAGDSIEYVIDPAVLALPSLASQVGEVES